jgi:catechol 2,3-dioxygenase-like lactoylglutathione lyase family enzyme
MDMKLELVMVPVTDVDRAKEFYERVGFSADHDQEVSEDVRFVQMTPPGSACSIAFGRGLTRLEPGSLDNLQMVVADADAVRAELIERGIEVSEVDELQWGRFVSSPTPTATAGPSSSCPTGRPARDPDGERRRSPLLSRIVFQHVDPRLVRRVGVGGEG